MKRFFKKLLYILVLSIGAGLCVIGASTMPSWALMFMSGLWMLTLAEELGKEN